MKNFGFSNGIFSDTKKIKIPVDNLATGRAYAVYEFLRVANGKAFYIDRHLARFFNSLEKLRIKISFHADDLKNSIDEVIALNKKNDFFVKIYAIPESPEKLSTAAVYIFPSEMVDFAGVVYENGSSLITREFVRFLPDVKSTNYMASIYWKNEMDDKKAIDILFVYKGSVLETSRGNIFIVKNNQIFTPSQNILKGITRSIVFDILEQKKIPYFPGPVDISTLFSADEIFITSTTKRIMPIVRIDEQIIATGLPGKLTKKILNELNEKIQQNKW